MLIIWCIVLSCLILLWWCVALQCLLVTIWLHLLLHWNVLVVAGRASLNVCVYCVCVCVCVCVSQWYTSLAWHVNWTVHNFLAIRQRNVRSIHLEAHYIYGLANICLSYMTSLPVLSSSFLLLGCSGFTQWGWFTVIYCSWCQQWTLQAESCWC